MDFSLLFFTRCFLCGFGMLFPGLSGAGISILLGIYDRFLYLASTLPKKPKSVLVPSIAATLGVLSGAYAFIVTFGKYTKSNPLPFLIFAIGSVIISAVIKTLKMYRCNITKKKIIYGMLLGFLSFLPIKFGLSLLHILKHSTDGIVLFVFGIILAIALILPGISFSYTLVLLGIYDDAIIAASEFSLPFLIPLAGGVIAGILLFSDIINNLIRRFPVFSESIFTGFTVASVIFVCV